jgi:protein SCO1/2
MGAEVVPIFISIDPKRDTPERLQEYRKAHPIPGMRWLTGSADQIESAAKAFRVYFSAPDTAAGADDDYLVDHSIFFYLMDRQGEFLQYFGKDLTAGELAHKLMMNIADDYGGAANVGKFKQHAANK